MNTGTPVEVCYFLHNATALVTSQQHLLRYQSVNNVLLLNEQQAFFLKITEMSAFLVRNHFRSCRWFGIHLEAKMMKSKANNAADTV